jgi:AcrR family transcriptional regulator
MADTTKERILDAARTILRAFGPEGLTVDAAAERAGVTRKTVYNHFAGRFALIDEAIASWMQQTLDAVQQVSDAPDVAFADKLNAIVERGFQELRSGGRILGRPPQLEGNDPGLRKDLRDSLRGFIERLVQAAADQGLIRREFDPRRLSWVFINIVEGLLFLDNLDDERFTKVDILKDSLEAIVGGILSSDGATAMRNSPIFLKDT